MFAGGPQAAKLMRLLFHLPNFIRLVRRLWNDPRVPLPRKALPLFFAVIAGIVGLAYVVRPVDLIFDYLPIIGRLDDVAVLALLLIAPGVWLFIKLAPPDVVRDHVKAIDEGRAAPGGDS
ncbi:DUF1232 domain-containing protein [Candidatus Poribacteria bacterium]|jgi:uncharacterized membrane protein YkvA (DUF1232 family)|nr:DUF1232 domain-containing protein [Candidatus Poribacteria bacterium]MBT5536973.1 DUF1232 domain-containing protein [Candidatus Poribacteria bacterium]MBT5712835.1 DUF1232 domain-containing protein [Candidatus Poribacteria bacterium]MBT7099368.1 DUF1232 domain-containing protein [Candidatus Poribacteria bacterium]MBT7807578.1 DUF1232 domain-containing protein [Candidatus Poribacteria bacterium]